MTSPVSKRTKPSNLFEDYIVNFRSNINEGLMNVADSAMKYASGGAGKSGAYYADATINIGFSFNFNNVSYKNVIVSTNGWLLLLDPTTSTAWSSIHSSIGTTNISGYINSTRLVPYAASNSSSVYELLDNFTQNHVLLAPWWMISRNAFNSLDGPNTGINGSADAGAILSSYVTTTQAEKIKNGTVDPLQFRGYSPDIGGVKYYNGSNNFGRYFLVRWKSFIGFQLDDDIATFETVLYENGMIEYRYGTRRGFKPKSYTVYNLPTATIGIFLGGKKFRDLSILFEIQQKRTDATARVISDNGGCEYDPLFEDQKLYSGTPDFYQSKPYFHSLNKEKHWPGQGDFGGKITISPPRNLRKQNKNVIRHRNSVPIFESSFSEFDDRKTVYFNPQFVSYPSMLPSHLKTTHGNKNSFVYQELVTSGSISLFRSGNALFDSPLRDSNVENLNKFESIPPFSENALFALGRENETFFKKGSEISVGEKPGTFSQNLSAKNQVNFSFRIKSPTTMLSTTSSIYYFSNTNNKWIIPTGSYQEHESFANKLSVRTLTGFSVAGTVGTKIAEDRILFDAYGNSLVSGTLNIFRNETKVSNQSNETFSQSVISTSSISKTNIELLTYESNKNVQINSSFTGTKSEVFSVNVDYPFLVEKVVMEIPINLGKSWFDDKTVFHTMPYEVSEDGVLKVGPGGEYYVMDEGGPALTFALFCQKKYGTDFIRDLIGKSILTHTNDTTTYYVTGTFGGQDAAGDSNVNNVSCFVHGMPSSISTTKVSQGPDGLTFSGSVQLKITPSITNGIKCFESSSFEASTKAGVVDLATSFLNKKNTDVYSIIGIDSFGRGSTGFAPSGGSVFGKEYATAQNQEVANSFYLEEGATKTSLLSTINSTMTAPSVSTKYKINLFSTTFVGTEKESPYMIFPGESLILSVSKTRPVHKFCRFNVKAATVANAVEYGIATQTDGKFQYTGNHDVTFPTGSINITLYGSYVKCNNGVL